MVMGWCWYGAGMMLCRDCWNGAVVSLRWCCDSAGMVLGWCWDGAVMVLG